jgi:hypothetical protein
MAQTRLGHSDRISGIHQTGGRTDLSRVAQFLLFLKTRVAESNGAKYMRIPHFLLSLLAAALLTGLAGAHVEVLSPNGGENLQGQQSYQVNWKDIIDHGGAVTYEVEFSSNNGSTWTQVVNGLPYTGGNSSYTWLVPDIDTAQGLIRVTMHVNAGTRYKDKSDGNFSVKASYSTYGVGTAVNGVVPVLMMHNVPEAGGSVVVHVSQAQLGSTAHIIAGSLQRSFLFAGVTILNNNNLLHTTTPVDGNGEVIFPANLPANAAGIIVNIQVVIEGPAVNSATAGVTFTIL